MEAIFLPVHITDLSRFLVKMELPTKKKKGSLQAMITVYPATIASQRFPASLFAYPSNNFPKTRHNTTKLSASPPNTCML